MNLIKRWNAYLGPKDERLVAETNRCMRIGYYILLFGAMIIAWYCIMVNQVSDTTDTPIYTAIGQGVVPGGSLLCFVILISCLITIVLEAKAGVVDEHVRLATIDKIPWDLCAIVALIAGVVVGVVSAGMRMLAEVQIVGVPNVTWGGDIAMGIVFGGMTFAVALAGTAAFFHSAIKRRRILEGELDALEEE